MKTALVFAFLMLACCAVVIGQPDANGSTGASPMFTVTIDDQPVALQASLYPALYTTSSAVDDISWVTRSDSSLVQFVRQSGDSIFTALSALSGIAWRDSSIQIRLLRYFPSLGTADPMLLPIGGIRIGALSEAIPAGPVQKLQLIYLLSHRMLLEGLQSKAPTFPLLSNHPLMQPTPLRRDNLAFLLALAVSNRLLGRDTTYQAYQSPFWKRHLPGREIFDQYLYHVWNLSPERPLTRWLAEEVADSRLVEVTDLATDQSAGSAVSRRPAIEGVSSVGRLGFSVRVGSGSQMIVDRIDSSRTAYRCGLRTGDVLRTVDGKKPRNQKELIELLLDQMESGGAMLAVTRNGKSETLFVRSSAKRGQ